jgi:hypothetical protein
LQAGGGLEQAGRVLGGPISLGDLGIGFDPLPECRRLLVGEQAVNQF